MQANPEKKQYKRFTLLTIAAVASLLFWLVGLNVNVYKNAFLGGFFELIWLPNLLATFCIPLLAVSFWINEKVSVKSKFLYLFIIYTTLVLLIWNV